MQVGACRQRQGEDPPPPLLQVMALWRDRTMYMHACGLDRCATIPISDLHQTGQDLLTMCSWLCSC